MGDHVFDAPRTRGKELERKPLDWNFIRLGLPFQFLLAVSRLVKMLSHLVGEATVDRMRVRPELVTQLGQVKGDRLAFHSDLASEVIKPNLARCPLFPVHPAKMTLQVILSHFRAAFPACFENWGPHLDRG